MAARLTTAKESSIYQTPEAGMIRREGSHMSTDMNIGSRTTRRQQILIFKYFVSVLSYTEQVHD